MWDVVPGETEEAGTCWRGCSAGEIHPFGSRESSVLLMVWLGLVWRGPGENRQGWSCSRKLLVLDNPTLPKGEAFQGRFHQSREPGAASSADPKQMDAVLWSRGRRAEQSLGTLCCSWET